MGGQREIGQRHGLARDPLPGGEQPVEIEQMLAEIGLGDAQHARLGRGAAMVAFDDLFFEDVAGHLVIELDQHPFEHAPHFGPRRWFDREQAVDGAGGIALLDGVDHRQHADDGRLALFDQDRDRGGRIELEDMRLAQPRLDIFEVHRNAIFGEHQPGEPGCGIEPMLQQPGHAGDYLRFAGFSKSD